MAAFKPIDPKRDEFRRYLEHSGLMEALTKALVRLMKHPDPPADPIAFLRNNIGAATLEADNIAYLRADLEEANEKIQRLRKIITRIDPQALEDSPESTAIAIDSPSVSSTTNGNEADDPIALDEKKNNTEAPKATTDVSECEDKCKDSILTSSNEASS